MAEDKLSDFEEVGKYLKATNFPDDFEQELTIDEIQGEEIGLGREKQRQAVMYFTGWPRKYKELANCGLVLGTKANRKVLLDHYGDRFADMIGKPIVLYRVWTQFQGEEIQGLRLRAVDSVATSETVTESAPQGTPEDDIPF